MPTRNDKQPVQRRDREARTQPELANRYGSIGISAVAAAARFNKSAPREESDTVKDPALMRRLADAAA